MQNQRKESRKKLIAFTLVYDLLHKKLIGYVGDLTPQGVMVIGETALEVGRRLAIGIEFPNEELNEKPQRVVVSSHETEKKLAGRDCDTYLPCFRLSDGGVKARFYA